MRYFVTKHEQTHEMLQFLLTLCFKTISCFTKKTFLKEKAVRLKKCVEPDLIVVEIFLNVNKTSLDF